MLCILSGVIIALGPDRERTGILHLYGTCNRYYSTVCRCHPFRRTNTVALASNRYENVAKYNHVNLLSTVGPLSKVKKGRIRKNQVVQQTWRYSGVELFGLQGEGARLITYK